jgi:sugar-specific transcriptional regulator TrmB
MKLPDDLLSTIGLSKQETAVYLAALELGEATVQDLARKSGVKRTSIYNFIEDLKNKQILFETKNKKRSVFSAASPAQLLEFGRVRLKMLEHVLPELTAINNRARNKPRVTFYEDATGIQDVYSDMLEQRKPIMSWSDQKHMWPVLGRAYCEYFPPERAKRGIPLKMIATSSPENRAFSRRDKSLLRETKFLPRDSDLKTEINVYGDKIILASFRSSPPFAVHIEDADIASTLRTIWEELWRKL